MNPGVSRVSSGLAAFAVAVLLGGVPSQNASAELRIQNHRFQEICRLVAYVDSGRGSRIVHDGRLRSGQYKSFRSPGSTVCIQRSSVPERCNSPLTRPVCKVDRYSNRTTIWTIQ